MSRGYPVGTEVQEKNGRVKKKVLGADDKSKWEGRNRINWMKHNGTDLGEGQRVFHIDGDKKNDEPDNLVAITFNGPHYSLSHSRVLWMPKVNQPIIKKLKEVA